MKNYVERNCCIEHEGKSFCSGGAVVTPEIIQAYAKFENEEPGAIGTITDWHGKYLGEAVITSKWGTAGLFSSYMYQIEAKVGGVLYTGRGCGNGRLYRGKPKKNQNSSL